MATPKGKFTLEEMEKLRQLKLLHPDAQYKQRRDAEENYQILKKTEVSILIRRRFDKMMLRIIKAKKRIQKELEKNWNKQKERWLADLKAYEDKLKQKIVESKLFLYLEELRNKVKNMYDGLIKSLADRISLIQDRVDKLEHHINEALQIKSDRAKTISGDIRKLIVALERAESNSVRKKMINLVGGQIILILNRFEQHQDPLKLNNELQQLETDLNPDVREGYKILKYPIQACMLQNNDLFVDIIANERLMSELITEKTMLIEELHQAKNTYDELTNNKRNLLGEVNQEGLQKMALQAISIEARLENFQVAKHFASDALSFENHYQDARRSAKEEVQSFLASFKVSSEVIVEPNPALNGQNKEVQNEDKLKTNINDPKIQRRAQSENVDEEPQPKRLRR